MAAPTFSLTALSDDERSCLLVLAVAGDWSSAIRLEELEHLTTTRGYEPMGRTRDYWADLLKQLAELNLVKSRESYSGPVYLLHRALAHEVLSKADPAVLTRLQQALPQTGQQNPNYLRQLARVSLYLGDSSRFLSTMSHASAEDWCSLFGHNPHPATFTMVPEVAQEQYLVNLAEHSLRHLTPMPRVVWNSPSTQLDAYRIANRALRGEISPTSDLLIGLDPESDASGKLHAALTLVNLANDKIRPAQAHGARALALSAGRQNYPTLRGPLAEWTALCALSGSPEECAAGELYLQGLERRRPHEATNPEKLLACFVQWRNQGCEEPLQNFSGDSFCHEWTPTTWIFRETLARWQVIESMDKRSDQDLAADLLQEHGYEWLRGQHLALLTSEGPAAACTLASMYTPKAAWERRLDRLAGLAASLDGDAGKKTTDRDQRLQWILAQNGDSVSLSARIQRRTKSGYTKGRKITTRTLVGHKEESWVQEKDREVVMTAHRVQTRTEQEPMDYELGLDSLLALAGHPRVFWEATSERAEVVRETPSIRVVRKGETIEVAPVPWRTAEGAWAERHGATLVVFHVGQQHVTLCETIGAPQITLPADAEPRLASILGHLSGSLSLQSDVIPEGAKAREVEADPKLIIQLRRDGEQLRARITVRPLGESGPICDAGRGHEVVVSEIGGVATQTRRDLVEEEAREAALFHACPSLHDADLHNADYTVHGLGACLELVQELHAMADEIVCLWSEGEPMRVDLHTDLDGLRFRFGESNAWLTADVAVQVSEEITLKAHELVSRMVAGSSKFVQLDDGRFVALSEELSRKIEDLPQLGKIGKSGVQLAPSNAYALSAWLGDLEQHEDYKGAKLAADKVAKVREAATLDVPLPTAFEAELREYQVDAYQWMGRLAHWGGGALLCDDMGLGKTVQMLAVLVNRASRGPALVVAPVSVCPHWINLMRRFAPTLVPRELQLTGRAEALASLGPRDVLLTSYGLLHTEDELLTKRTFQTIVLDEAQAIKNPRSQRARAAHRLQGEFRVVTTGTPIENHLGELWSIMNFANPGLLGTGREFSDNFGKPIQRDGDRKASARLRRVLRPFLLRRTKAQVLDELPPKTEITLEVEPGPEEAQYYAAMRDAMLAEIQAGLNRPTQQRIQILAALMKLRRIACHPKLVDAHVQCGSAKQETFMELVRELREAGHRILVFSQFVGHLAIARESLDRENISYKYLDGQTPKSARSAAVDAFQGGEGDVFLISLKAGGVGLDLTGADYVIHLDPWWNPAVEDQASDRAHRIGQTRPVTVYRLVTKGTVEQKVLELHARKRQLAEDLISGNESATPLGVDDLVDLMRDIAAPMSSTG